jgi:CheY-like chemotaxis protein
MNDIMLQGEWRHRGRPPHTGRIHIPVILITDYSDTETIEKLQIAGSYGYILKPSNAASSWPLSDALHKQPTRDARDGKRGTLRTLSKLGGGIIPGTAQGGLLRIPRSRNFQIRVG